MELNILIGRRQPAHDGHIACIIDVIKRNGFAVVCICSANHLFNKNYDPISSPLTAEQVTEQMQIILDKIGININSYKFIKIADVSNPTLWTNNVIHALQQNFSENLQYNPSDFLFHFFAKPSANNTNTMPQLDSYAKFFKDRGIEPYRYAGDTESKNLSSTAYRHMNVDDENFETLPAADYLRDICYKARKNSIFDDMLSKMDAPITMRDLTLKRLYDDHGVTPEILKCAQNPLTNLEQLDEAIRITVNTIKERNTKLINSLAERIRNNKGKFIPDEIAEKLNQFEETKYDNENGNNVVIQPTIREIRLYILFKGKSWDNNKNLRTIYDAQNLDQLDEAIFKVAGNSHDELDKKVYDFIEQEAVKLATSTQSKTISLKKTNQLNQLHCNLDKALLKKNKPNSRVEKVVSENTLNTENRARV